MSFTVGSSCLAGAFVEAARFSDDDDTMDL